MKTPPNSTKVASVLPGKFRLPAKSPNFRFDSIFGNVTVSSLFVNENSRSNCLVVLLNGAINRDSAKDPREIFQRRTWSNEIHAPLLYLADPTILPTNEIQIGWMQGTPTRRPLLAMSQCVEEVRDFLQIANENILFFGSSAGGFQALQLHASFPGSRFLVNNAQFDWSVYYERFVNEILEYSYPGMSLNEVKTASPSAVNVLNRFKLSKSVFNGEYLINTASKIDYFHQLPVLNKFVEETVQKPIADFNFAVSYYHDPASGHLPLGKATTLQKINETIDRLR